MKRKLPAWLLPGLIFLLAFALRLIYLVQQSRNNPIFSTPILDAQMHDEWARRIAAGDVIGTEVFFRAPLYYYFLGLVYFVFGHHIFTALLVQSVIGSLSAVLVYFLARKIFPPPAAAIAGLLAAGYWIFIYFDNELLISVLIVFLDLALMISLLRAEERPSRSRWFLAGALLGLSAVARPNVLLFAPFVPFWLFLVRRGEWAAKKIAWFSVLFAAGAAAAIAPVTLRNYLVGRDFVPIASQGGVNFYLGNNPDSDGVTAIVPGTRGDWKGGYYDTRRIAEEARGRKLKPSEVSDYWTEQAFRFIRERPGGYLKLLARKFYLFWQARELVNDKSIYFFRRYSGLMKLPLPGFGLVAPLGLVGMILAHRRHWRKTSLAVFFVFAYMTSFVLFFVNARYRVPVIPFLIVFAAYALVWFYERFRRREFRPLAKALAVLLALGVFVYSGDYTVFPVRRGFVFPEFAQAHHILARAYERRGRLEEAEKECREALRLGPELPEVHACRGDVFRKNKKYGDAEKEYLRALEMNPLLLNARINLGGIYGLQGKPEAAMEQYRHALSIEPDNAVVNNNLGTVLLTAERLPEAEACFRRALAGDPAFSPAWKNLAEVYRRQERRNEEADARRKYFTLVPEDTENGLRLGSLFYQLGRKEEAKAAFRQVLKISPEDPSALNNLGFLYVEEGINREEGISLIKRALARKPDEPAFLDSLGWAYHKKGDFEEALKYLRQAIKLAPDNPRFQQHLKEVSETSQPSSVRD